MYVLDDRSQQPHMKLTAVDKAFGVAGQDEADGGPLWHATHPPATRCESIPS